MTLRYPGAIAFLEHLEMHGIKLGLENIRVILATMGDPQLGMATVVVGGTNGKGSVASMVAAIGHQAGYRVGLYTSPHLIDARERIVVDGTPISGAAFARAADVVRSACERARVNASSARPPTYFEAMTAMAFAHFAEARPDLVVLEVGMGGRFDATNVTTPLLAIVTNVSLDHTRYLGKTVREIAQEKAGILKPRVAALTMARERALGVIRGRARQLQVPLFEAASECQVTVHDVAPEGCFSLRTPEHDYERLRLALAGRHQIDNAVLAVRAAEILAVRGYDRMAPEAVTAGLAAVRWPGRLDLRPGRPPLLLDGAHNPDGARALRSFLAEAGSRDGRVILMALSAGRDPREMGRLLLPLGREAVLCPVPGKEGVAPGRLFDEARRLGIPARVAADWRKGLATARRLAHAGDTVVVTGSLYLVGAVLGDLEAKKPARKGAPGKPSSRPHR